MLSAALDETAPVYTDAFGKTIVPRSSSPLSAVSSGTLIGRVSKYDPVLTCTVYVYEAFGRGIDVLSSLEIAFVTIENSAVTSTIA